MGKAAYEVGLGEPVFARAIRGLAWHTFFPVLRAVDALLGGDVHPREVIGELRDGVRCSDMNRLSSINLL
jgi:hypothetical protein